MDMIHYATFFGLYHWARSMYQRLGYMVLAYQSGYYDSVESYLRTLLHLMQKIEERLTITQDYDRRRDLVALHDQVYTLYSFADQAFGMNPKL